MPPITTAAKQNVCWIAFGLWILNMTGCGGHSDAPPLSQVTGTVTYQGKPLTEAQVMFTPEKGPMSMGVTDTQGRFSLKTGTREGVPVGKHTVTISAFEPVPEIDSENETERKPPVSRIPRHYSDLKKSGLSVEVNAKGKNDFTFELK